MSAILPAGTAVPRLGPYRVADYDRLPDEPRYELVFGRFHLTPSRSPRHQISAAAEKYQSVRVPEVHLDLSELWRQVDACLRRMPRAR